MQAIEEGLPVQRLSEPELTDGGVRFAVSVEREIHWCIVTNEALNRLSREHGFSMDAMNTYRAFEARIGSVARSRLLRGDHEPLVLESGFFH